jgi:signal peptidase I
VADRPPEPVAHSEPPDVEDHATGVEVAPTRVARAESREGAKFWRELPALVVVALVVAILIKTFLVQAFYIPSESMEPTLRNGDRVLVCRFCYRIGDIHRGDIVVFSDPAPVPDGRGAVSAFFHWLGEGIGVARPADEDFIKRVIGLPGDIVEIERGTVYVNGEPLDEPYLDPEKDTRTFARIQVPDGMLFVLGDNRAHSGDSRFAPPTGVGYVPVDKVIGKAFVIVWPPGRWGWI